MDRYQKYVGEVSVSSFSIAAEHSRVLIVSTDKNLSDKKVVTLYLKNCLEKFIDMNSFPFFCCRDSIL